MDGIEVARAVANNKIAYLVKCDPTKPPYEYEAGEYHSMGMVKDAILLDVKSALTILSLYDRLDEQTKVEFKRLHIIRMAKTAWDLMQKYA